MESLATRLANARMMAALAEKFEAVTCWSAVRPGRCGLTLKTELTLRDANGNVIEDGILFDFEDAQEFAPWIEAYVVRADNYIVLQFKNVQICARISIRGNKLVLDMFEKEGKRVYIATEPFTTRHFTIVK
jgi:hypothetical protein